MKHKAKFKNNNGFWSIICSKCGELVKEHFWFTEDEKKACKGELKIPAQYCDVCEEKMNLYGKDEY